MEVLKQLNEYLWNFPMLVILLGTHLFFTFRLKFVQKNVFKGISYSIHPDTKGNGDLSSFASLATTLAATLGTGNIIGVSTAIALGGPGALFWCWVTGILGMATTYAECYLSLIFRKKTSDGTYLGGPMYFLQYGVKKKWLAVFYALATLLASFGVGCTTQANAISTTAHSLWNFSPYIVGFFVAIPVGLVLIGGIKSIGKVCTTLVPAMGFFYIIGCTILIILNFDYLGPSLALILKSAFVPTSIGGGIFAATLQNTCRYGIARGLFTNEAGLGSAGIAAATAKTDKPYRQALISMTATFWDTVVMCAVTGIIIVIVMLKTPDALITYGIGEYTSAAFGQIPFGPTILGISLIAFASATLLGWFYFGEKAADYLFGKKAIRYYQFIYIVMIYIGAVMSLELVWELTDFINVFMAIPCIYGLFKLQNRIGTS